LDLQALSGAKLLAKLVGVVDIWEGLSKMSLEFALLPHYEYGVTRHGYQKHGPKANQTLRPETISHFSRFDHAFETINQVIRAQVESKCSELRIPDKSMTSEMIFTRIRTSRIASDSLGHLGGRSFC